VQGGDLMDLVVFREQQALCDPQVFVKGDSTMSNWRPMWPRRSSFSSPSTRASFRSWPVTTSRLGSDITCRFGCTSPANCHCGLHGSHSFHSRVSVALRPAGRAVHRGRFAGPVSLSSRRLHVVGIGRHVCRHRGEWHDFIPRRGVRSFLRRCLSRWPTAHSKSICSSTVTKNWTVAGARRRVVCCPMATVSWLTVSFRQACMRVFGGSGMVGCRSSSLRRTADGHLKDTQPAWPTEEDSAAFRAVEAKP